MMQALIVEDERLSAERLKHMIAKVDPQMEIVGILDSVKSSKEWLRDNSPPDVLFLDIQLNDGTGFDLLNVAEVNVPVIFTTAYDNYAIKAFKFNSIDYLLKPIEESELEASIKKLKKSEPGGDLTSPEQDFGHLQKIITGDFKQRFLVKLGDQYQSVLIPEIAYFQYNDGMCYVVVKEGRKYPLDYTMDQLEGLLNPLEFYRVNRQLLVSLAAIKEIHSYFNSRLLLRLAPDCDAEVIVSRDRVSDFKRWMDL
ncbi:MAG: LytTR family DNA-binding domain-containing protein [Bacteroidota bacterium]